MIDTHSHIADEAYAEDFEQVVARAREAGVTDVVVPAIEMAEYEQTMRTCAVLEGFAHPCIGLHPTSVGPSWRDELQFVFDHADDAQFCAIGEIGLDRHWGLDFYEQQKQVFADQLAFASERDLPVIIHCREAVSDIIDVIRRVGRPLRGVFHAFSGSYETYQEIRRCGDFSIGVGGVVTFKNAHIAAFLHQVPLEHILLETDAPWLTPAPFRGRRNESSYLQYIIAKVAELKGLGVEEIDSATTDNARNLFKI